MKSVSFKNLVLLIIFMLWGRVWRRYGICLVSKARLEDVCRVGFHALEEVIVG